MAVSDHSAGVLVASLLLIHSLLLTDCNGQAVTLTAGGTGQTYPFNVAFGDGQPTASVTDYLPWCVLDSERKSWIRLEKTDGSLVLAKLEHSELTVMPSEHPILDTSHTGLYHCRTVDRNSTQTYQLNIVAKQSRTTVTPTTMVFNYTDQRYDIPCNTVGSSGMSVTWTSTLDLRKRIVNRSSQNGLLEYENSTFSFMGNDSSVMLTGDNPAGVRFNVTCTAAYETSFNCRFVDTSGGARQPSQDVLDRCVGAVKPLSTAYSISIQAPKKSSRTDSGTAPNKSSRTDSGTAPKKMKKGVAIGTSVTVVVVVVVVGLVMVFLKYRNTPNGRSEGTRINKANSSPQRHSPRYQSEVPC
ncbi:uncharacterized protein LOC135812628 [Sycon ciliatum]|uniref:uncharacterized protein LOC135812628 n=1 Tax=Sycon ciliatum TaxID=27933 RepID=UPI0031F65036